MVTPMRPLRASAPAKINLGLFVGPAREQDGRHELASVMQSISLADQLTLESADGAARAAGGGDEGVGGVGGEGEGVGGAGGEGEGVGGAGGEGEGESGIVEDGAGEAGANVGGGEDEIVCPGVAMTAGENLAARALRLFREATGWDAGPLRLGIDKRIPVAAGLGGGSADAAAALRMAMQASGLGSQELLLELAGRLGADVPAQIAPGRWLARGAGERLRELPAPSHPFGVLVLPVADELSTAAVYARADELGVGRTARELKDLERELAVALELSAAVPEARELLHNDLQAAAISLCPRIELALTQALDAGADVAFVSGSGPTVVGLFLRANGPGRAERAAAGLAGERESAGEPAPICAVPVDTVFARVE
jgi:4-diphosphocytidyl-2-C-methyl-D-erythritol kinase